MAVLFCATFASPWSKCTGENWLEAVRPWGQISKASFKPVRKNQKWNSIIKFNISSKLKGNKRFAIKDNNLILTQYTLFWEELAQDYSVLISHSSSIFFF